jgi:hypothetical protein
MHKYLGNNNYDLRPNWVKIVETGLGEVVVKLDAMIAKLDVEINKETKNEVN